MNKDGLKRHYSFLQKIKLLYFLIRTKFLDKNIRLIRFPIVLRGKKYIEFGHNLTTGYWCRFEVFPQDKQPYKRIILGNNIQINDFVHISAINHVKIGDNCLLASHIYISDNSHGLYTGSIKDSTPDIPPVNREYITNPVNIGSNCWIGEGVIILPGVSIGSGCVIGAHSVVNKDIPNNTIAVGSPAKIIKKYNFKTKCWEKTI